MTKKPTQSEVREATRSFNEKFAALKDADRIHVEVIIKELKSNLTKIDWIFWEKQRNEGALNEVKKRIHSLCVVGVIFAISIWILMHFDVLGNSPKDFLIPAIICAWLIIDFNVSYSYRTTLNLELERIKLDWLMRKAEISNAHCFDEHLKLVLTQFVECIENEGVSSSDPYVPIICNRLAAVYVSDGRSIELRLF
jgi:hypothetical protein